MTPLEFLYAFAIILAAAFSAVSFGTLVLL